MLESTRNTWHVSWSINSYIYSTLQFSHHEIQHLTYEWFLTTSSIVYDFSFFESGNDQSNMLTWPFTALKYIRMPEVNRFYSKRVLWSSRLFAHDKIYTNISCVKARTLIFKSNYRLFKNKLKLGKMKTNIQTNRLMSTMQLIWIFNSVNWNMFLLWISKFDDGEMTNNVPIRRKAII